jgi:ATP-dependent exoDNAse (exonuclease V) beta subunit
LLTGLGAKRQWRKPAVVVERSGRRVEVRSGDFQTAGYAALESIEERIDQAEGVRLLYVAATRARDHLVLCLYRGKDECHAKAIAERLVASAIGQSAQVPHRTLDLAAIAGSAARPHPNGAAPTAAPEEHRAAEATWLADRAGRVERLSARPVVSATRLAGEVDELADGEFLPGDPLDDDGHAEEVVEDPDFAPVVAVSRRGATALGRAVHAVLQTVELDGDPTDRAVVVEAATRAHGVGAPASQVARFVEAVLGSQPVRRALVARRRWREVPVGCVIDGVVLEGRIDLLYEDSDGSLTIVEFKTDLIAPAEAPARAAEHRAQGGAYALALERATGRPVGAIEIVFAALDGDAVRFEDIGTLTDRAAELVTTSYGGRM